MTTRARLHLVLFAASIAAWGCGGGKGAPGDGGGADGGVTDAGGIDASGIDASGIDAGPGTDAGAPGTTSWHHLAIGAGGYVTGIDIAPDGTKVVRTDTDGAHLYDPATSRWSQLVTAQSMPASDVGPGGGSGVYGIAIAKSQTMRFYMIFHGSVFRTDDRGHTWTKTAFANQSDLKANGAHRIDGRRIAVDPNNPDVVYVGTVSAGLQMSDDAGATWSMVGGVPNPTGDGGMTVAFDPSSSVSGGKTQTIYVASYGHGVYASTDGGTSFSPTSGGPSDERRMVCDGTGRLWVTADSGSQNLWKLESGTWTNLDLGGQGGRGHSIAVDPNNPDRIYVGIDSGDLISSTDAGAHWTQPTFHNTRTAMDIPWLGWTQESYMSNGDMAFDPTTGNLWFAEGVGVWMTDAPGPTTAWMSVSRGIENLVANWVVSPPGGKPVVSAWDRPVFYVDDPTVYPSTHGVNNMHAIVHGWSVEWASAAPMVLVGPFNNGGVDTSGKSTDGGRTWSLFGSNPAGVKNGGSIAASTAMDYVWIPADSSPNIYYTNDGGDSWHASTVPGVPTSGDTGWDSHSYLSRHIVCADRVAADTFYAYNNGQSGDTSFAGVYKSTDGGATFTKVKDGVFTSWIVDEFNAKMRCVPDHEGNLFYTAGSVQGPPTGSFWRSTDGGATWTAIPNVLEVDAFGFGKAKPGSSYPTIYIAGWVDEAWGIYRSTDGDQPTPTWTPIAEGGFPLGNFTGIQAVEGDADTYGTVYIGTGGAGFFYGTLN